MSKSMQEILESLDPNELSSDLAVGELSSPKLADLVKIVCMSQIETQPVHWLWYPYIPRGKITILQGDPGDGKTTLALHIAAQLSRGLMYGREQEFMPGRTVVLSAEDGYGDTIKPRLLAANANERQIFTIEDEGNPLCIGDERLELTLNAFRPDLLILDPLQAFLGADVDMHRANEVRPVMSYLAKAAECTDTAILLIGHMNKRAGDKSMYRGLGSIDIAAAARSVLVMTKHPQDADKRVLLQVKSSLAKQGDPLVFTMGENSHMELEGIYEGNPEGLLLHDGGLQRASKVDEAKAFLESILENGELRSDYVLKLAGERGINASALKRARKALKIKVEKRADGWYVLP